MFTRLTVQSQASPCIASASGLHSSAPRAAQRHAFGTAGTTHHVRACTAVAAATAPVHPTPTTTSHTPLQQQQQQQQQLHRVSAATATTTSTTSRSDPIRSDSNRSGSNGSGSISNLGLSRRALLAAAAALAVAGLPAAPPALAADAAAGAFPRLPTPEEQAALDKALKTVITKQKSPVALRLIFHDVGTYSLEGGRTGGANASVQFELERPENFGLKRGWRLIEQLRDALKGTPAEAVVSDADLIALAGAAAVERTGGPRIPVRIGRTTASGPDPEGRLPGESFTAEQLKANFADKGISAREFLVLCGSHTIGSKGFGDPYTFDVTYFKELLKKPWTNTKDAMASMIGLPTDHVLPDDPELAPMIPEYAADQALFFNDFTAAYLKLSELGAVWRRA